MNFEQLWEKRGQEFIEVLRESGDIDYQNLGLKWICRQCYNEANNSWKSELSPSERLLANQLDDDPPLFRNEQ